VLEVASRLLEVATGSEIRQYLNFFEFVCTLHKFNNIFNTYITSFSLQSVTSRVKKIKRPISALS